MVRDFDGGGWRVDEDGGGGRWREGGGGGGGWVGHDTWREGWWVAVEERKGGGGMVAGCGGGEGVGVGNRIGARVIFLRLGILEMDGGVHGGDIAFWRRDGGG